MYLCLADKDLQQQTVNYGSCAEQTKAEGAVHCRIVAKKRKKKRSKLTQEAHGDKKNEGATALHYPPQPKANSVYTKTNWVSVI